VAIEPETLNRVECFTISSRMWSEVHIVNKGWPFSMIGYYLCVPSAILSLVTYGITDVGLTRCTMGKTKPI